jgi:hypothetical protein
METGIAQVDDMPQDEDREKGERNKSEEYVKGYGGDDDIPVVLLIFFKQLSDDIEN